MPKGELYIKTAKTGTIGCRRGMVEDTENVFYGYADAYVRYGLSLAEGAIDKLMAPVGHKAPLGQSLAIRDGVAYHGGTVCKVDERDVSIDVGITAWSRIEYMKRYMLLCDEVLSKDNGGLVYLRTCYLPDVYYRLVYQTSEQFRQWMRHGMAMMTLVFKEPHPELRSENI